MDENSEGPTPGSVPYDLGRWAEHFGYGLDTVVVSEVDVGRYKVEFKYPSLEMTLYADRVKGVDTITGPVSGEVEDMEVIESLGAVIVTLEMA